MECEKLNGWGGVTRFKSYIVLLPVGLAPLGPAGVGRAAARVVGIVVADGRQRAIVTVGRAILTVSTIYGRSPLSRVATSCGSFSGVG